jgi:hypothetical protein
MFVSYYGSITPQTRIAQPPAAFLCMLQTLAMETPQRDTDSPWINLDNGALTSAETLALL